MNCVIRMVVFQELLEKKLILVCVLLILCYLCDCSVKARANSMIWYADFNAVPWNLPFTCLWFKTDLLQQF